MLVSSDRSILDFLSLFSSRQSFRYTTPCSSKPLAFYFGKFTVLQLNDLISQSCIFNNLEFPTYIFDLYIYSFVHLPPPCLILISDSNGHEEKVCSRLIYQVNRGAFGKQRWEKKDDESKMDVSLKWECDSSFHLLARPVGRLCRRSSSSAAASPQ